MVVGLTGRPGSFGRLVVMLFSGISGRLPVIDSGNLGCVNGIGWVNFD